jgi:phosphoribosylanthranilate isomerase
MFVKICGLTDPHAIDAAVESGADALGFVFAESPREIEPVRARELCRSIPKATIRVAVMHHPSPQRLADVIETFNPDWIQTDVADFNQLALPGSCRKVPVFRDGQTTAMTEFPARLVFEGKVSGSGATADWAEARRIARQAELILAGGLDPDNVGDAIRYVRPFGVDVSSGVEYERGKKDPRRIRQFVARVRAEEFQS